MKYELFNLIVLAAKIFASVLTGVFLGFLFSEATIRKLKNKYAETKDAYTRGCNNNPDKKKYPKHFQILF